MSKQTRSKCEAESDLYAELVAKMEWEAPELYAELVSEVGSKARPELGGEIPLSKFVPLMVWLCVRRQSQIYVKLCVKLYIKICASLLT